MDIWDRSNQEPSKLLKGVWAASYAFFIAVNLASSAGWLGATNAEVSAKFSVPITPAGWAFAIWGVIFLLQGLGTIYLFLENGYDPDGAKARYTNAVGPCWAASWLAAAAWQFAFVQQTPGGMWLAAILIASSLAAMSQGLARLYKQRDAFGSAGSTLVYAAYFLPTSIMAAWLSVATAVQLVIAASSQMQSLDALSIALAAVVAAGGLWVLIAHKDTAYGLTQLWAFLAVFEQTPSVAVQRAALGAIVLVFLGCLASVLRRRPPAEALAGDWEARQPLRSNGEAAV